MSYLEEHFNLNRFQVHFKKENTKNRFEGFQNLSHCYDITKVYVNQRYITI